MKNNTHLLAATLLITSLAGCADFSGITPQAQLRDASSFGLPTTSAQAAVPLDAQWWRAFGDDTLNQLVAVSD